MINEMQKKNRSWTSDGLNKTFRNSLGFPDWKHCETILQSFLKENKNAKDFQKSNLKPPKSNLNPGLS